MVHQHFCFEAKWTDILQTEGPAKGYQRQFWLAHLLLPFFDAPIQRLFFSQSLNVAMSELANWMSLSQQRYWIRPLPLRPEPIRECRLLGSPVAAAR